MLKLQDLAVIYPDKTKAIDSLSFAFDIRRANRFSRPKGK
jgi:hypothetical protein